MALKRRYTEDSLRALRVQTHLTFGKEFLRSGKYERALEAFDEVISLDPHETRGRLGRSLALTRLGRFDEALAEAEVILGYQPHSPHAYNAEAVCYQTAGFYDKAEEAFEKAVAYGWANASIHYNYACFWAALNNPERCREYLDLALALDPQLNASAATDVDFETYRNEDWFLDLVAFQ